MSDNTSAIFTAAADKIERSGLHKGDFFPKIGPDVSVDLFEVFARDDIPMCAMGAIRGAHRSHAKTYGATSALQNHVRELGWGGVPRWNDAPDRTQEDVVATLRKLADDFRAA